MPKGKAKMNFSEFGEYVHQISVNLVNVFTKFGKT